MSMATILSPSHYVLLVYDATRDTNEQELGLTIHNIRMRGDILRAGDTLVVLGVLHTIHHPMGYHAKAVSELFVTSNRATEEEVLKKVDAYVKMLHKSAEICKEEGVTIEVKVTAGFPVKQVILQQVIGCNATWVILDRLLRRDMRYIIKQIPCKVAFIQDNLSLKVEKNDVKSDIDVTEHKYFISKSKPVPPYGEHTTEQHTCRTRNSPLDGFDSSRSNLMSSSSSTSRDYSSSLDIVPVSK